MASSFTDTRTAINAAKENLRNNAKEVAQWLKSNPTKPKVLEFSHKYEIGYGVQKGNMPPIYGLKKSRIILEKDSTQKLGFKIITAFPL